MIREQCEGKTIARVFNIYDDILFVFTDGSSCLIELYQDYDVDRIQHTFSKPREFRITEDYEKVVSELLQLGAVSKVAADLYFDSKKSREEYARRQRLEQYKQLKQEFEP